MAVWTVMLWLIPAAAPGVSAQELKLGNDEDLVLEKSPKEQADEFFQSCLRDPVIGVNESTDKAFCACASNNLYMWLETPGGDDPVAVAKVRLSRGPLGSPARPEAIRTGPGRDPPASPPGPANRWLIRLPGHHS